MMPPAAPMVRVVAAASLAIMLLPACGMRAQSPAVRVSTKPGAAPVPVSYVIGPEDVLYVTFWRDKEMSAEVVVRPDGHITLPLLNDIQAAGLTPDALRMQVLAQAERYVADPAPTVAVKEVRSRKVFITGQVGKPGMYTLGDQMSVMQLIALAGGLGEEADEENILVMRSASSRQVVYKVDYNAIVKRRNMQQNIDLEPGDTVVVP